MGLKLVAGIAMLVLLGSVPAAAQELACLAPEAVTDGDGDFRRNADRLGGTCTTEYGFVENGRSWVVHVIRRADGAAGPLWAVPHDDEDVAFDSGVAAVAAYGGAMVSVEAGGSRTNGGLDPNRLFTGDSKACGRYSPIFTSLFVANWNKRYPVFGLHSNDLGNVATGGLGVLSIDAPLSNTTTYRADPVMPSKSNVDTMVFVASENPPGQDRVVDTMIERLLDNGVNVQRERVSRGSNDCSLSNFMTLRGVKHYYNIEVLHGDGAAQRQLIHLVLSLI